MHANPDQRARDDQMIGKIGYIPAPSPAPPLDGSYYNMNSDRYLSYPPMDYPQIEFSTPPPMPLGHMQPNNIGGGGTLRRGQHGQQIRGMVPPPDVTHHTAHTTKSQHDLHNSMNTSTPNGSQQHPQLIGNMSNSTISQISAASVMQQPPQVPKLPQGILKDPKRNQQQQNHSNVQILNVQNVPSLGNNLLVGGYDPTTTNLSSFNASLGYTDADGHLV